MSSDLKVGDWAMFPGKPETAGEVFDIRDYGLQVWVRKPSGECYYTEYDQLVGVSLLERMAWAAEEEQSH